MRLLLQHRTVYSYPKPANLGPHVIRLRPATHARAHIESYSLTVPDAALVHWQQDPQANHVARLTFREGTRLDRFEVVVELAADIRPINPFDFFIDAYAEALPFAYPTELARSLSACLDLSAPAFAGGPLFEAFVAANPGHGGTVAWVVELAGKVASQVRYVIREESGIWTPEETLAQGRGSCRDSAVLLVAALRRSGLAARFASGYLVQLADEGMIPDQPRGVSRDVVDLHAWAEVYLPGGGWIGIDGTSGLLCGEGHIPLACTPTPALASPIEGTSDVVASELGFEMIVGRVGHEPRPTTPYTEAAWETLLERSAQADARLVEDGIHLTLGGEPTFNSREHPDAPEWGPDALGESKWALGLALADALRRRLAPGGLVFYRQGKHYPGESLPRWALDIIARRQGDAIWPELPPRAGAPAVVDDPEAAARVFAEDLARRLGFTGYLQPAFEDPWHFLMAEASLPPDADALAADLSDAEARRRLARVLGHGLGEPAGWVLPLTRARDRWHSSRWTFRRGHVFLVPGDSPIGLRLPLDSLPDCLPVPSPVEPAVVREDPRLAEDPEAAAALEAERAELDDLRAVRTALCVEAREGRVHVFMPPLWCAEEFFALVEILGQSRAATGVDVQLGGYSPPSGPDLFRFAVTPDPGVLEVNLPPVASTAEYDRLIHAVFDCALASGLHSEKYMLDGRQQGSGGGNHLTMGGPKLLESPFILRPDLLASLITFTQHHPSLSYLFTGLFVGPTSQAPRVDEARHDALYELELALERAHACRDEPEPPAPWLGDMLFRNLLVDVAGSTHRAEISIDKLCAPSGPHGRQGLVELRAYEMPPHPRMATAQAALARTLVAAFARTPYRAPLVRWGQALHDRYLLPYYLWRDFEDVLAWLEAQGTPLPADAYQPFLDLRCPLVGRLHAGDVTVEVRNALEPWPVLGEEATATGTARYVDSSMERVEIRASGLVPERHAVVIAGLQVPLRATNTSGEQVGGVRFRAWAPPHSLQPHIGIHHPLRIDVVDLWAERSLGGAAYHVWHPEGRSFDSQPLTRFEAAARRAQRFTLEGPRPWPVRAELAAPHPETPYTLDLRRFPVDHPMPEPPPEASG
ncbi:MAG: transglutaminase family protein [Deltaproteobacteria bacterium]|nr:transglutaminase family protein [Deltaproteobacteria bacterium]